MTSYPFNRRLKLISNALELQDRDIARAVELGGGEASRYRASCWNRSPDARKRAAGRRNADQNRRVSRFRPMLEEEFDAFCVGLKPLLDELDELSDDEGVPRAGGDDAEAAE